MKRAFYLSLATIVLFSSCGETSTETEEATEATAETTESTEEVLENEEVVMIDGYSYYGIQEFKPEGAISMEEMTAIVDSTGYFEGKVTAQLAGVCKKAGCWVTLMNPGKEDVRVFFGEHDFLIPTDTEIGKEVVLEGKTDVDTFTVEFQKHLLDDEAAAGAEIPQSAYDAITEDKIETSFIATGILIKP